MTDTVEASPLLGQDAFQTDESQRLFEAIDDLRRCGAKQEIDLPELVIIGDQSAGKSSLLQSLVDIPFPVAGHLCTRFPTRIISRRTTGLSDVARVSIEPSLNSNFELKSASKAVESDERGADAASYDTFARDVPHLDAAGFKNIMSEASKVMGIGEHRNFSNDVLRIEISGPTRSHFSIVDVPGIFQSVTKDLTKQEMAGVRSMVESYIKPKQSVIICVANGMNDLVNQAVFDMARSIDPEGERSVGVITKCDATQHPMELVKWAQNEEMYLAHGWFVVRNRTPPEAAAGISSVDHLQKEKDFFEADPWESLSVSRRGTEALKKYLAQLLCNRIQDNFPTMLATVQARKAKVIEELNAIAAPRETLEEKRAYLSRIAHDFSSQSSDALRGRYDTLKRDDWKIRKLVRQLNEEFAQRMFSKGHYLSFADVPQTKVYSSASAQEHLAAVVADHTRFPSTSAPVGMSANGGFTSATPNGQQAAKLGGSPFGLSAPSTQTANAGLSGSSPGFSTGFGGFNPLKVQDSLQTKDGEVHVDKQKPHKSVFTLSEPWSKERSTQSKANDPIYVWIGQQVMSCRGTELQGTINPDVLPILFRKQSAKWEEIAQKHFSVLANAVETICLGILENECEDRNVRKRIQAKIGASHDECMERGGAQLARRVAELQSRHLQTHNPDFERKMAEAKRLRFCTALERFRASSSLNMAFDLETQMRDSLVLVDLSDIDSLFKELHMSNARNLENEIHDTLKAYYEIERANFIENVTQLIVETYLNDPDGPVLQFSPMYVSRLTDKEIEELAAEDESLIQTRKEKEATLSRLKQAEAIAKKWTLGYST